MTNAGSTAGDQSQAQHGYHCDCGCMGLGPLFAGLLNHVAPKEARDHFQTARVEILKGIRSVIDARIDDLSKAGQKGEKRGTTVPVE